MEKIIAILFIIYAIYTLQYQRNIIVLLACNYILSLLMKWYHMDFGINMVFAKVYPSDVMCFIMLFIMFASALRSRNGIYNTYQYQIVKSPERKGFILFTLIVIFSTFLGFISYGINSDFLGDVRKFAYLIIPIMFFSTRPTDLRQFRVRKIISYTMNGVFAFCYIYWIVYFLTGYSFGSAEESMRCISSDAAYVLAIYAIYLVYKDLIHDRKRAFSIKTILSVLAILMIQFNSAYMTLFSGLFVLLLANWRSLAKPSRKIMAQILILCVAAITVVKFLGNTDLIKSVISTFDKFSQATSSEAEGTIGGRYEVWALVIATLKNPIQWLIGKPMGNGYHVLYRGGLWAASPHSGYVECLMRTGIIGCIFLLGSMIILSLRGLKENKVILTAMLIGTLFYWYPYTFTFEAGFIIGNIIWYMYNDDEVFKNEKLSSI